MREQLPKIAIIVLLVLIVGVPILLAPSDANQGDADGPKLVIYTPHNEQIRHEIRQAFNKWRVSNGEPAVVFDWRTPGGTTDIRKGILSQFEGQIESDEGLDKGIGVDLFFGGGWYDHGKVADGLEISDDSWLRVVDDPQIDTSVFKAAFPTPTIGSEKLYLTRTFNENGEDNTLIAWTGVTLSSFGIVYNNDTLKQLGIDRPKTWRDLGDSRFRGWVALADPGHSGSISATFDTILRREGWNEGWRTLRMMYANARYFASDATRVPVDVSRGDAAAGLCIDFYGRFQAGAVGEDRVGYSDPVENGKSMTATTADPITLLRGAPNGKLAREFIAWLISPEAQSLWQNKRAGSTAEAADNLVRPDRFELRRQPIRRDVYTTKHKAAWTDQALDPYTTAVPFPEGTPNYFRLVAPVTKAMAIDIHHDLIAAWTALNKARQANHPNLAQMQRLFFAMPEELAFRFSDPDLAKNWRTIHYDPSHPRYDQVVAELKAFEARLGGLGDMDANRVRWRGFFQKNYREVVRLGSE